MAYLFAKRIALISVVTIALAGCQDRIIWQDNDAVDKPAENREVWNTNGKMGSGDRPIWVNKDGEKVVK